MDVADSQLGAGRRHDLHDADGTDLALGVLIELRFLVALRGEHQRIEAVALAVAAKEGKGLLEAFPIRALCRVLELLHLLHRPLQPIFVGALFARNLGVELADDLRQLRPVLVDCPADTAAIAHEHVFVDLELGQDLRPQLRLPVIDDQHVDQTDVGHLHHVLVLEDIGYELEIRFGLAFRS